MKDSTHFSYERTLLCGRYRDELRAGALGISNTGFEASNSSEGEMRKRKRKVCGGCPGSERLRWKQRLMSLFGEDWIFLALLGIIMAILSFIMDYCIEKIQEIHLWLFEELSQGKVGIQYLCWVGYTLVLVLFSVGFVAGVAPQAIGSGIPEMKTILRGVVLKEYLTWKTLIAKMVGLTVSLGSGLPVGKEGPFVHVASIVATLLSRMITSFKGIFENESRSSEMLAAACAVGVACTFGAPVGGVLFSIEVTSVYFAVRNYWRGFFAAACSATVFRLLAVGFKKEVTVIAFYKTSFPGDTPFYPEELIPFSLIGVVCGFGGALFVLTHRSIVLFMRHNRFAKAIIQKNLFIYPVAAALLIASVTFPPGYGQFIAGHLTFRKTINNLFANFSWNDPTLNYQQMESIRPWSEATNIYLSVTLYCLSIFFLSCIANTLPLPAGVFIPVFVIGASFGRLAGEGMAAWFPNGLRDGTLVKIIPGGYAVVGAAAFAGSVTHTVSVSVIVFELTGQLVYILPVMLAVLIANAICSQLQPSIYDSMIQIKHLPYLPDILPTSSSVHKLHVEDIMVRHVCCMSMESTYEELQDLLIKRPRLRAFPLVDKPDSMVLLGSILRKQLEVILNQHVGEEARIHAALSRTGLRAVHNTSQHPQSSDTAGNQSSTGADSSTPLHLTESLHQTRPKADSLLSTGEGRGRARTDSSLSQSRFRVERVTEATPNIPAPASRKFSPGRPGADDDDPPPLSARGSTYAGGVYNTIGAYMRSVAGLFYSRQKVHHENTFQPIDMNEEERKEWEEERLAEKLDFDKIKVDPAPFQLVEKTSLYKVHSLFSLLGLNRAYVTCLGRLVGVVALRELRHSLEHAQRGVVTSTCANDTRMTAVSLDESNLIDIEGQQLPRERARTQSASTLEEDDMGDVEDENRNVGFDRHKDSLATPAVRVRTSSVRSDKDTRKEHQQEGTSAVDTAKLL